MVVILDGGSADGAYTSTDAILARHVHELASGNIVSQDVLGGLIV